VAGVFIDTTPYEIYAGDAWSQSFEFGSLTDPDDEGSWVGDDLSEWSDWSAQWRVTDSAMSEITLTVDATGAADGVLVLSASEAQTRAMAGNGVFDIQAATPRVRTFLRAKTHWKQDVTRD